jgi:hypothetical protein
MMCRTVLFVGARPWGGAEMGYNSDMRKAEWCVAILIDTEPEWVM